jgi:hypothetical protein
MLYCQGFKFVKHQHRYRIHFKFLHRFLCAYLNHTASPVILIRHTEFHMQPTSAGPGIKAHYTHGMPKSAQHFLVKTRLRRMTTSLCLISPSAKTGPIEFTVQHLMTLYLYCGSNAYSTKNIFWIFTLG